jgi:hypothetical protein
MTRKQSSARKGKATEHLVAAMCVLASEGELNALTALVDDEGVDLGLKRRDGNRVLDVQVKSAFLGDRKNLTEDGTFIADVRLETFRPRDDLYILYVIVDGPRADIRLAWLVPSDELEERGFIVNPKRTGPQLRFQASSKPQSRDKWHNRRLERDAIVPELLRIVRRLDDPGGPLFEPNE